ncbi:MAG: hypothetical protein JSW28_08055 [Thermoplasmata archaeon]|nr:MAG: hypothetical protein JSW28_08055 [Thermoplasmata archaeon]
MRNDLVYRDVLGVSTGCGDEIMADEKQAGKAEGIKEGSALPESGAALHTVRSKVFKRQRALLLVLVCVLAWMVVDFSRIILTRADDDTKFLILTVFYLITVFVAYTYFLVVFDNIVIFERGILPPVSKEKKLRRTLPSKRTFIPFSVIADMEVIDQPKPASAIVFSALERTWIINSNWDVGLLARIIRTGINNKYILDFELESIIAKAEHDMVGVEETKGEQDEKPVVEQA